VGLAEYLSYRFWLAVKMKAGYFFFEGVLRVSMTVDRRRATEKKKEGIEKQRHQRWAHRDTNGGRNGVETQETVVHPEGRDGPPQLCAI
jgi:hypothetical protein